MKWEDKVEKFGNPSYGQIYDCKLKAYRSGTVVNHQLVAVNEDDHLWVDLDGDEINEMAFDVISWVPAEKIKKGE